MAAALLKELHLFKEQIAERLSKLAILHQQEVAQRFKVSFHPQLHKEVVHYCLVHQRYTADGKGGKCLDTRTRTENVADLANCVQVVRMIDTSFEESSGNILVCCPFLDDSLSPITLNYFCVIQIYTTVGFRLLLNGKVSREEIKKVA